MDIHIAELIAHPEQLNKDTLFALRELIAKYPYYQAARLLFLRNLFLLHDPDFGEELRTTAGCLPDHRVLFEKIEADNYAVQPVAETAPEKPAEEGGSRTIALIDDFLRTADLGDEQPKRKPTAADATSDYSAFLLLMDDAEPQAENGAEKNAGDRSAELIDDFMEQKPSRIRLQEEPTFVPEEQNEVEEETADDAYLTMTLAKIYIKQQRYEKALEIMRKVNLNNPKKSAYFADQIRFLQKLIINQNHQNHS